MEGRRAESRESRGRGAARKRQTNLAVFGLGLLNCLVLEVMVLRTMLHPYRDMWVCQWALPQGPAALSPETSVFDSLSLALLSFKTCRRNFQMGSTLEERGAADNSALCRWSIQLHLYWNRFGFFFDAGLVSNSTFLPESEMNNESN